MPYDYHAPLREMRFVIERVLDAPSSWRACTAFVDVDAETAAAVLDEAARFAREVLLPLNAHGDVEGCTRGADGAVRTPAGFREAYRAFVDGGWPALPCAPKWGGQGLPLLLDAAVREMLDACNHAWNMYPDLLHGAYETLAAHAGDELKARYLPMIASGEWLAAMALTEPQAGSDLGALRTRAEPQSDGSVRVTGQKVFISGGDHDLTDNIVHLVLCRLPDSPPGSRGLSLALVPKVLPDGARNAMHCDGLERKMGIHGSATCAMRYEGATGWLVGEPHRGLAAMFLMMNSARLHVGLQGLGHLEMAAQNARRHAAERVQFGRPIAEHPAVRHALLRLRVLAEALRVIAYRAALALDEAAHLADAARRERAGRLAALLTPVVKAWCTHHGFHGASAALQVFGGYGYVREVGVEQTLRDARIAMVYEGTNEIQAIDLVQRKLLADGGATLAALLDDHDAEAARCAADPALAGFADALRQHTGAARDGFAALQRAVATDPEAPLRVADDVLAGLAHTLMAWAFAASARAAAHDADAGWAAAKVARMRYGVQWLLPQAAVHWQRVAQAPTPLPAAAG
ncbi:acyl-CoA dehydrogenase family protein [Azohydromonas sp.]|mgnify:CR=1 FL=1|uniref:acyl-CoA dehydrogenase family protein n=1 Tax=Azohydromonas sp. TaxID=1872666 RepID=UPI002D0AC048|nr:acyl-CoA dehydrogenase family protein [Azohydromonas sp.]HMM84288.1 acyl-CoA dehydrogenase family protein [Azohydromonas sp.]